MTNKVQDLRDIIRGAISFQRSKTPTVLSSLLAVEDAIGYIPQEAVEEVAIFTNATSNDVWGVASFYTNFRFSPPADHVVEVCWGPSCHVQGAQKVLRGILDLLEMSEEGDTEIHDISLKYNTCLGACPQAPVISIDHYLIGRVTVEDARNRVNLLRDQNDQENRA
ncbi:MAG: hypothetical protein BZY82_07075 [SAR202 cluster bacterium Io17-Chloro-G3]|nr:MAG: hypothetical protein BZY82_07075 [SAR202 cluster bacterium Io17-Chloro-G3]